MGWNEEWRPQGTNTSGRTGRRQHPSLEAPDRGLGGAWPRNTYLAHSYKFPGKDAAEDFHVYALEWNADEIKWFVDGVLTKTRTKDEWFSEAARDNPAAARHFAQIRADLG